MKFYIHILDIVEDSLPLLLLEELFELLQMRYCEEVFSYIELRQVELFIVHLIHGLHFDLFFNITLQNMVPNRGKGLVILRICNELLRRSSKSVESQFCGRILFFLAKIFPLTERSGRMFQSDYCLN
jgi:hypothetical protein